MVVHNTGLQHRSACMLAHSLCVSPPQVKGQIKDK